MAPKSEKLTKKCAEKIKEKILEELENQKTMLDGFLEQLQTNDSTIYIGNPNANNEEVLSNLQAQIARKNLEVEKLHKRLVVVEHTIQFRKEHPKMEIPENPDMYTGKCIKCHSLIPQAQRIARCAPITCVSCSH
ncbi:hypothetical protein C4565_04665 [Candidatus Parcubacteria bacterium]|jgi:hypothetical protein|nr:MAG: hypothetical protein C4565_04665 [Candidatus Parcubacteria bacterium]